VWFTDYDFTTEDTLDKVERMTLDGNSVDKFDLALCSCAPYGATYGPDGNMWFTEEHGFTPEMQSNGGGTVDKVSLDGKTIERYPVRLDFHEGLPQFLTPGPDGNVWFTQASGDLHSLGRVTPAGVLTTFHIADNNAWTNGIATGADGEIWFAEASTFDGDIWRMHPDGSLIGTSIPVHYFPVGLALGPDGNLWFAARSDGEIGVIHAAPAGRSFVLDIASGFTPSVRTVSLGRMVEWVMEAPGMHRVHDRTGMDLYDSGLVPPVSRTTFRFPAAGTWGYEDGTGGHRGKIAVNLDAPATAHLGHAVHVAWATAGAPDGAVFDVQVMRPGEHSFSDFRVGTATHGGTITPHLAGAWRFRSRMHDAHGGTAFSPVRTIRVS